MTKSIAILLTVYNRKEKTVICLRNIYKQTISSDYNFDVYMTDDGCTDGTPEEVRNLYPDVHVVAGDGTLFWNRGMHKAWSEAKKNNYDYYLWLNDDTFIYTDSISRLLCESEKNENQAIIVGSTCSANNKNYITYGGWTKSGLIADLSKPQMCDMMNGNIVLIPKYVYEMLGLNDPYYRHALGDMDYCIQARKKGVSVFTGIGVFGECEQHPNKPLWKDPSVSFYKRWKNFWKPNGANPIEFFYYRKKNFGIFPACITFVSNFIHVLFPYLWNA